MKTVTAGRLTYDAELGRIEPGQIYELEDDKAERWITGGIATAGARPRQEQPPPQPPQPDPPPEEDDEEEEEEEGHDDGQHEHLRAEVRRLMDAGGSQRSVAQELGISRATVKKLLSGD